MKSVSLLFLFFTLMANPGSAMTQTALTESQNTVVCAISSNTLEIMKVEFEQNSISMNDALTLSRCELRSNDLSKPLGRMLHRTVNAGEDIVGIFTNTLNHLKSLPREERLDVFSILLDGLEGHRTLFEEILVAYENHEDKYTAIRGGMRRLCRGIEIFEFQEELARHWNSPNGCQHPLVTHP